MQLKPPAQPPTRPDNSEKTIIIIFNQTTWGNQFLATIQFNNNL